MQNIKKLYSRLTMSMVKKRTILFLLAIQNIIITLLVLMYANVIISNGKVSGELNYSQIKLFYNTVMILLLLLPSIYAPYFLAGSINSMKKNNTIDYMLSTKVRINEIVYAAFLRGLSAIIVLLVSSFPIVCVSFYFGGIGSARALKYIIFLLFYSVLISAICIYISTLIKDSNLSILVGYIASLIIFVIHTLYLGVIIDRGILNFMYVLLTFIISICLVSISSKSRILLI